MHPDSIWNAGHPGRKKDWKTKAQSLHIIPILFALVF